MAAGVGSHDFSAASHTFPELARQCFSQLRLRSVPRSPNSLGNRLPATEINPSPQSSSRPREKLSSFDSCFSLAHSGLFSGMVWAPFLYPKRFIPRMAQQKSQPIAPPDGHFEPLIWEGSSFRSPGFSADGTRKSKLRSLQITNLSAHLDWWQLPKGAWVIDHINAEKIEAVIGKEPAKPLLQPRSPKQSSRFELPEFFAVRITDRATVCRLRESPLGN